MTKRFSLGIDLGTTNCAIALTDLEADQTEVLEVTQILGPNRIGERRTLKARSRAGFDVLPQRIALCHQRTKFCTSASFRLRCLAVLFD